MKTPVLYNAPIPTPAITTPVQPAITIVFMLAVPTPLLATSTRKQVAMTAHAHLPEMSTSAATCISTSTATTSTIPEVVLQNQRWAIGKSPSNHSDFLYLPTPMDSTASAMLPKMRKP